MVNFWFCSVTAGGGPEGLGGPGVPSVATAWAVSSGKGHGPFSTSEVMAAKSLMSFIYKASRGLTCWTQQMNAVPAACSVNPQLSGQVSEQNYVPRAL